MGGAGSTIRGVTDAERRERGGEPREHSSVPSSPQRSLREGDAGPANALKPLRCYFGAEFCQTLLPSSVALRAAYETAVGKRAEFTFVTPPVTDSGLAKLGVLIALLASEKREIRDTPSLCDSGYMCYYREVGASGAPASEKVELP